MRYYPYNLTILGKIYIAEDNGFITNISFKELKTKKEETPLIKKTYQELKEFLNKKRKTFDIPILPNGTNFQKRVWEELLKIPYGQTVTYKNIAQRIGNEKACRAVGMANNKNPIVIIIPCHRVVGANNNLTGYSGGVEIKQKLLELENI